jgi:hypothetical protein
MSHPPIQSGQEISVQSLSGDSPPVDLRIGAIEQRNWSRVAVAEATETGKKYFVKQYLERAGTGHPDHWEYEKDGALLAAQALDGVAHVPTLMFRDEASILNVFEYASIVSIDVLLRKDPVAFERSFLSVVRRMAQTLEALQAEGKRLQGTGITTKRRDYGGSPDALTFKGFEIRNVGISPEAPAEVHAADLVLFDFVRPYLAPPEEAAAKLFVSIGMLNWGSPVSRFMKGPDPKLLALSYPLLKPWLDKRAIAAEIDLQERFRMVELKSGGNLEKVLKRIAMSVLGRKYLHEVRSWCHKKIGSGANL